MELVKSVLKIMILGCWMLASCIKDTHPKTPSGVRPNVLSNGHVAPAIQPMQEKFSSGDPEIEDR